MKSLHTHFPGEWRICPLGTLLREVDVRVADLPSDQRKGIEVLSLTKRFGLIPQSERFDKRVATANVDNYKIVRRGWIVYNPYVIWEGAIHALKRDTPGIVSPVYPVWERIDKDGGFLDLILRTPELIAAYEKFSAGAVNRRRSIKKEGFLSIEVATPPLAEQRKIARVLSLLQRAIEQQEQLIALTVELKSALLHKLFTQGLHGEPQKQTEIGPVPESWEVNRLGDHCVSSAFGPRFSSDLYTADGNVVTLRTTDLDDDGNIDYRDAPKARLQIEKFESHLLKLDDIIVSRSGTCGIAAVFEGHVMPVLPGAFLIRVRLASGLRPQFLRYYINSPVGRPQIMNLAQGAIQKNISGTALRDFEVPVPNVEEQADIEAYVKAIDQKLWLHTQKTQALTDLFRTLLHQLMTAQIRVHDLDLDEILQQPVAEYGDKSSPEVLRRPVGVSER